MKQWVRRLRGVLGTGALWGVAGTALGTVGGLMASLFGGVPLLGSVSVWGLGAGVLGFLLGSGFAGVLTAIEGRRTLDELSVGRAAVWGALAGGVFPIIWLLASLGSGIGTTIPIADAASGSYGALSAALAAGTVALAKHLPPELAPGQGPNEGELLGAPGDG